MTSLKIFATFIVITLLLTTAALPFTIPHRLRVPPHQFSSKSTSSSSSTSFAESSPTLYECFPTDRSAAQLLECIDQITKPFIANDASRLGSESIFERIREERNRDIKWAKSSALPFESEASECSSNGNSIEYESIYSTSNNPLALAIRSKLSSPLLSGDEIQLLRGATESYWNRSPLDGRNEILNDSRFTYQRKGNKEAHLSDVVQYDHQCNASNVLTLLVRNLLLQRIFPWIREAYLSQVKNGDELELYAYDSLFIRYNATEANANINASSENFGAVGAGQPLHRDLGYVSVNIMLNSQEEFIGGGTFFEDQVFPLLTSEYQYNTTMQTIQPLKPLGPGHALAHFSNKRHAGAATHAGVRDILVIFLAATEKTNTSPDASKQGIVPCWEYNARIKANARTYCSECSSQEEELICRMIHHRLAIDQMINDGEAWHYCGMALLEYHAYRQPPTSDGIIYTDDRNVTNPRAELELAVACLYEATKHIPCDGRLYNNLGIALERLLHSETPFSTLELNERVISAYEKSITIHSICDRVRCDVGVDHASARVNYGLYLSKRDQFSNAIDVLSKIVAPSDRLCAKHGRLIEDSRNLLSFCKKQLKFA